MALARSENRRMFQPSQHDVRRFFCEVAKKRRAGTPLEPIEALAADWIARHPEYENDLADAEAAAARDYTVEAGRTNPFLHLSMHLSITEQLAIDQPPGIKAAHDALAARHGAHEAQHAVMECLGETLWAAQRSGRPPDGEAYLDCVRRRAR